MLIQILVALLIGILAGIFTGLIPGIHINLIGVMLVSLSASLFSSINPLYFVVFIVSLAITHTFLDFIPSILLGCPDTDTELSVLPGHEMLKQGQGYKAIKLTAYGSIFAVLAVILISFPAIAIMEKVYSVLTQKYVLPGILILVSGLLIMLEKKKFTAFFVFVVAGLLGLIVLNLPSLNQPLLPLLTGLFGGSMLIVSIRNKIEIPEQKIEPVEKENKKSAAKAFLGSLIASPLCSFLPGLGSSQAAIIGNVITRNDKQGFLILLGATNTLVMGFSFISLYAISRTRTGAAVAIQELIGTPTTSTLILILAVVFLSGIISFFLTDILAKIFVKRISKIKYSAISYITIIILLIIVFLVSGFLGTIILIVATFTGIYCISSNVKRTLMMSCLLLPTIILYIL